MGGVVSSRSTEDSIPSGSFSHVNGLNYGSEMVFRELPTQKWESYATKGNKISIWSFEVANTIVKGANLMQSLSKDNIEYLKEVVLPSEGVQRLISEDMNELLSIAAADKREELKVFSGEVVRFGNLCVDPQWHNLDRFFGKLGSELIPQKQLKKEAEIAMEQFKNLAQYTAELYLELIALDNLQEVLQRIQADSANAFPRGDSLTILRAELKSQRKRARSLKKKSFWSKILDEVMVKFLDIVLFLLMEIHNAFGSADGERPVKRNPQKLGPAGLALHYANIITQINSLVACSSSVHPGARDALYQGLPPSMKVVLCSRLRSFRLKEELTIPKIKAEMEKTLKWLVPIATNTTKAHHSFGWVGEWANSRSEPDQKASCQTNSLRIETLYHADKAKTEDYIFELVLWLHHLVSQSTALTLENHSPVKSRVPKQIQLATNEEMLRDVNKRKVTPGISKSQEFDTMKSRLSKHDRLTKSTTIG